MLCFDVISSKSFSYTTQTNDVYDLSCVRNRVRAVTVATERVDWISHSRNMFIVYQSFESRVDRWLTMCTSWVRCYKEVAFNLVCHRAAPDHFSLTGSSRQLDESEGKYFLSVGIGDRDKYHHVRVFTTKVGYTMT